MKSTQPVVLESRPAHSLHDALRLMLTGAAVLLEDRDAHAARREMKRIRAALRLLRAPLGETAYRRENRQVRDAARPLAPLRDTEALLRALGHLRRAGDGRAYREHVQTVQRALEWEREARRRDLSLKSLQDGADQLRRIEQRLGTLPAKEPDPPAVKRGMTRMYKSGRRALTRARRHPDAAALHEWRKRAKYLSNQVDLAVALLPVKLTKLGRRARKLAELLGEDHDLAVLGEKLRELRRRGLVSARGAAPRRCKRRLASRRRSLQRKAFRLGRRLYARRAARFAARLERRLRG